MRGNHILVKAIFSSGKKGRMKKDLPIDSEKERRRRRKDLLPAQDFQEGREAREKKRKKTVSEQRKTN